MTEIKDLLENQSQTVNSLLNLLKQETLIIASKNASEIEKIAKEKLSFIGKIITKDKELTQYAQTHALTSEHEESIVQIKKLIEECHSYNYANGIALERVSLSMHKLRNLFEESMGKDEMTYDEKGKSSTSQTLGTNIKA